MVTVEPTSPVPLKVGRGSFVLSPVFSVPVTGKTSSTTVVIAGAAGGAVSTLMLKTGEFAETLPAASLALTLRLCGPSVRLISAVQIPDPLTVAVAISVRRTCWYGDQIVFLAQYLINLVFNVQAE
jgi:hypothetical protein